MKNFTKILIKKSFRELADLFGPTAIPSVAQKNWSKASEVQWKYFQENPQYFDNRAFDSTAAQKQFILGRALEYSEQYEKVNYPFLNLFFKEDLRHKKVLHIASGIFADLLPYVEDKGLEYYLEDPLLKLLDQKMGYYSLFSKLCKDFCSLTAENIGEYYQDQFFDYVICHNVLNHTYGPEQILDNIYSKLKIGGKIYLHHIDQDVEGTHPLRINKRQLLKYFQKKDLIPEYQSDYFYKNKVKKRHSFVLKKMGDSI